MTKLKTNEPMVKDKESPDTDADTVEADTLMQGGHVGFLGSSRLALSIIGFFIFFHVYALRVGMSVAIVCMVNQTAVAQMELDGKRITLSHHNNTKHDTTDVIHSLDNSSTPLVQCDRAVAAQRNDTRKDGEFVWGKEIQGHVLGSFFYGYLVSQIPGGLLAERFGAKWVIVGFLGLSTLCTLLTPVAARVGGYILLIGLRVLCGIGSGALFPAMHAMLGRWAPPAELSTLCGIAYAGAFAGNVITFPVSGVLCQHGFDGGWASIFYIIGISTVVCLIVWSLITSSTPAQHPRISKPERDYITNSFNRCGMAHNKPQVKKMPWLKMFTSGPVWAIIVANFCTDWGLYTYLTNLPTFYREVLYFDIQSNGVYSALPFLGVWASMSVVPIVSDKLISSQICRLITVRKLFNSFGMVGAGVLLIALSFIDCHQTALAVALMTIAVTTTGCITSGYVVNHMDIAPQYAGTLMGIANGIASMSGFIAPYVASVLTKSQTRESWQIVFLLTAGVYTVGTVTFCLLASGEVQPWAKDPERIDKELSMSAMDPSPKNVIYKAVSNEILTTYPLTATV